MRWRRAVALAIVVLFLGMTVSSASVEAKIVVQEPHGEGSTGVALNPGTPGNQSRPENIGAIGELAPRILSIDFPIVGEIVIVAQLAEILVKVAQYVSRHTYGKPVAEFTKGFIEKIPAKHDGYTQVTKMNFWGTKVEIGYGYVKSEWWGLRKETVIVEHVITVNRDDVTSVCDLFSPEEYGKLLAMAWLNGWDAEKAKEFAEELYRETRNLPKFEGRSAPCGYWPPGRVRFQEKYLRHLIRRHLTQEVFYGEPDATLFPKDIDGKWLADVIKKAILEGEVNCEQSNLREVALEVNTEMGKVRVVLRIAKYDSRRSLYDIITAYLVK